ncbi:MAG: galactose mutarotase [Anaerolineae bacterium]|nr:galactose mutarotase [Anaerolineae bacterium]
MEITKSPFGQLPDGTEVPIYALVNASGMTAKITPYGGIIQSLTAPDRAGRMGDVVLGFDTLAEYLEFSPFFGCLVGRYANRIANASFTLDGVSYALPANNGVNTLHGGLEGFDKRLWASQALESAVGPALSLRLVSPDGDQGFPGALYLSVVYTLADNGALRIDYTAQADKPTVLNVTNHSYFNLSAGAAETVHDHQLMVNADAFTPGDAALIPTGEVRPVEGTPMDLRTMVRIGDRVDQPDEQLANGGGFDHNWVLNAEPGTIHPAARLVDPTSGRLMEVWTTEPGVQVYTANMLGPLLGKGGRIYGRRGAICLETQHYPDSPNKPEFPTTVLRPGETFKSTTIFRFSV